ncbi:G-protein coupled receptor [Sporobolomyces koalae]|uniref:G-protein coupled receptor n=1 Tax=Sporobolomyces koalae TaxID=500713 RepID=UPI00317ECC60
MGRGATIADLCISACSLVGALSILGGFLVSSQRQHIRQKVVLGLGVVDLVQALDTLVGSINELRGRPYISNTAACNASAFFYQFSSFGSACLTLIIALITYASLAHPLAPVTAYLEHRYAFPVLMGIVFLISFVPALPLTLTYDLVDVRGVCWFVPSSNASKLVIFVPRAFVLVCVILLYTRLLIFFQRRDMKLFGTNSMSQTGEVSAEDEDNEGARGKRFSVRRMSSWTRRSSNFSNAHKSDTGKVSPQSASPTAPHLPFVETTPPSSTHLPAYTPHSLATIPASPNPGEQPFTNPFPQPEMDLESGSKDLPTSEVDHFLVTPNDSRRPSDQPSSMSHFRIDEGAITSQHQHQQSSTGNRTKRPRGQLSPRQVNRRLSVLLMLYPLAYMLLIAVSLARLIQQLATKSTPSMTLSNISRWLIYSQGLIDGLLFTVIRWVLFNFGRSRK